MTVYLGDPLGLLRASRYARPADAAAILPDVYGDVSGGGGLRGPCPAVCVDTTNFIYLAAAHAVQSIDSVWDEDVLKTAGVDYTANVAYDLESQGDVAVIDFASAPTGQVSWAGYGKVDGNGDLISGAVEQVQDLLETRSGAVATDLDQAKLAEAKAACASMGHAPGWLIADARQVGDWLTELLFNVAGRWRVSGAGKLEFLVDTGAAVWPLEAHVVAARDCEDGEDGVVFRGDAQQIANALTILYAWSWSTGTASSVDVDQESTVSKNAYGEARKIVTLRGLRSAADVAAWAGIVLGRSDYRNRVEGARLEFTVRGPRLARVAPGDFVSLSWDAGPTREAGAAYRNEVLQVLTVDHRMRAGALATRVAALDTGAYLTTDPFFDAAEDFDADVYFGGDRSTVLQP